jgi:CDP-4-dehydro-6-deoxyglucose reductase, E3
MIETAKPNLRQVYKMNLSEIRDHNPQIRELFIETPETFKFRAGQFCMLHVPQPDGAKSLLRAYSFASTDENTNGFRLVFKYVDQGAASEYVWSLRTGDTLEFTGPFGRLFFKEPPTEQIVMLNTGSGISQHFCFLESLAKTHPNLKYRLLFGVRTENDIYYEADLKRLQALLPNFEYHYVLSRAGEAWQGLRGHVQKHISQFDYLNIPTTFYMCGNGAMIKDTKAVLNEQGFDPKHILAEAFD